MTNEFKDMKCRGCCGYPNGKIGIAAVCVSVIGFIMAIPASFGCRYFKQEYSSSSFFYFGLFSYQDSTGTCLAWSDASEFTTAWKFAKAMAILAFVLAAIALSFTLSLSCVSMPNIMLKCMAAAYIVAGCGVILTLTATADCNQCSLAGSGIMAIIAPLFYFATAVILFKVPRYQSEGGTVPRKSAAKSASGKQEVIETITELPDGTRKRVKTTTDEFGNKTIEETIEEPEAAPEEDMEVTYLPDGSIKTTRTSYAEDGTKIVRETIEQAPEA